MKRIRKDSRLTFVELPPTQFGVLNGPGGFDIYSHAKLPSRAIPTLRAVMIEDGYSNTHELNPKYHGEGGKLTAKNMGDIFSSDILFLSAITRTAKQTMTLADLYRLNNQGGIIVAGGPDPTFRSDEWLNHVDIVVRGEGEATLRDLATVLSQDPSQLESVRGIQYNRKGEQVRTEPRPLLTETELGQMPHPVFDPVTRKKISTGAIELTRGCPHNCDYCAVTSMYGNVYRRKPIKWVLEEMNQVNGLGKRTFVVDDNVAPGGHKDIERLETMAEKGDKGNTKVAQITVYVARSEKLMEALRKIGVDSLCVGIESLSDETLKDLGKSSDASMNRWAIPRFRERGFFVHGMMMLGGNGDTPESLRETEEWANRNLDSVQYFTPVPIPGTRFRHRMKEEGRVLTEDWALYDAQHVLLRPVNFTPIGLQERIEEMYGSFYSIKNLKNRLRNSSRKKTTIVLSMLALSGGLKKIFNNPQSVAHKEFLRSIS
ncbi:MAG: B12-binding domain-containing radical SAM protein [Nanoarchaeota archaeon]|nr:B12-binding domain-containing radical SAM protein [Nanoarchaeota archaeon]